MTLQPYDGARHVLLPDGIMCWEKETAHIGGSETTYSYQYSVELGDLPTDYYGRVCGLKVRASDGNWNEIVTFLPVSLNLIDKIRALMEQGWAVLADRPIPGLPEDGSLNRLYSPSYLSICEDVINVLKSGVKKS
jgi:hypothetical protein